MENNINQPNVTLRIANEQELEKFKTDLQEAFRLSAEKEFGHALDEPIPSDTEIEESFKSSGAVVYHVLFNDTIAGGAVVAINEQTQRSKLLLFFISDNWHNKGLGYKAWKAIENMHPETKVWETVTPYFEKRNIHFYVNKCKFKIVEFYNKHHIEADHKSDSDCDDEMFRFEKHMENIL